MENLTSGNDFFPAPKEGKFWYLNASHMQQPLPFFPLLPGWGARRKMRFFCCCCCLLKISGVLYKILNFVLLAFRQSMKLKQILCQSTSLWEEKVATLEIKGRLKCTCWLRVWALKASYVKTLSHKWVHFWAPFQLLSLLQQVMSYLSI